MSGAKLAIAAALALLAIPAAFLAGRGSAPEHLVLGEAAPAGGRVAFVLDACADAPCHSVWIGPSRDRSERVMTLTRGETCDEIAWSADGTRVAFLVNGYQLRLFDPQTLAPAGQFSLFQPEGTPSSRVARGVTFSENGRAVTFDDCPRGQSGCRSGLVGLPK